MKKRILSVFLALVIMILMMPNVFAADTLLTIQAEDIEITKGTTTFEVDIEITENPGVATLGFNVGYDSNVFTLKNIKNGVIFADDEIDSNIAKNPFIISAVSGKGNKTAKGVLVTLVFDVKSTSATGTYNITLSENETLGGYYNYNENEVPALLVSGSVSIKNSGSISGSVKSYGSSSSETTIELLKENSVIATKKVKGNNTSYTFDGVDMGTYTVRASKTKHAPREYTVVLSTSSAVQNVEIWLYGDVTVDGLVNSVDIMQMNRKATNMSSVFKQATDLDYRLKVANITAITGNDVTVNNIDALQINRKIANLTSLFDSIK